MDDLSFWWNACAILLSVVALLVSVFFASRQSTIMRHSNTLAVVVDLLQEFRSLEFQRAEAYVLAEFPDKLPTEQGLSAQPELARVSGYTLTSFFSALGSLVALGIVEERVIVPQFGYRANRAWTILEPYILAERELRGGSDFANLFEDLVCRIRANWPPDTAYKLRLRRLPRSPAPR